MNGRNDWYFQTREGNVGPYESRMQAGIYLQRFIKTCLEYGHTGNRDKNGVNMSEHIKMHSYINHHTIDDFKWRF